MEGERREKGERRGREEGEEKLICTLFSFIIRVDILYRIAK